MQKQISIFFLFTVLLMTTGCNEREKMPTLPTDFAFIFEQSGCGPNFTDVLNTKENLLVQKTPEGEIVNTISLELSDEQMNEIYTKTVSMDFFSYPEIYVVPDEQIRGYQAPAGMQKITVTANSQTHSVTWSDEIFTEPPYMDEINLRELSVLISKIIFSHPDYQVVSMCA